MARTLTAVTIADVQWTIGAIFLSGVAFHVLFVIVRQIDRLNRRFPPGKREQEPVARETPTEYVPYPSGFRHGVAEFADFFRGFFRDDYWRDPEAWIVLYLFCAFAAFAVIIVLNWIGSAVHATTLF